MKRLICSLLLFVLICPESFSQPINDVDANSYRLMTYNIHHGVGIDNILDLNRIASIINRETCDVVALQELDSMTQRSGGFDMLSYLANQTLMYPVYASAMPYQGGKYGIGLLSKEKPIRSYQISLPGKEPRTLLIVEFKQFYMGCTHWDLTPEHRIQSVEIVRAEAAKLTKPFILAGDLNAYPDSPVMAAVKNNFTLLNREKPDGQDTQGVIDYLAVYKSEVAPLTTLRTWIVKDTVASDHQPVLADIRFKQNAKDIFYSAPYLQNPVDGGITVMWQTRVPTYSWVEYGTDSLNLKRARTIVDGQVICNDLHQKIRIEGIEPGKKYYYRVCSQEIMIYQAYSKTFGETSRSPLYSFTLPSSDTKDFTALIFNDLHKQEATLKGLMDLVKEVDYDFVFFNGDCIDDPATEREALFHIRMQCEAVDASNHPVFYLRGNHEIRNAYSIGLRALFDYVGDKTYGSFSWGDTRFVMLDCGEDKADNSPVFYDLNDFTQLREDQVGFLKKELSSSAFKKASKRVLLNHIPLYRQELRNENRMLRNDEPQQERFQPSYDLWNPLLSKAPFNINISAHTHRNTYISKGAGNGNNFPVVIGGSQRLDTATVMILRKKGKEMTLRVLNGKGETVYDTKL